MNNLELTYIPYSANLKKPFQTSGATITERNGFILFLKSNEKSTGIGEAAPLPEFGSETYEDVEKALENFSLALNIDFTNIEGSIEQNLSDYDKLPSFKMRIRTCNIKIAL